MTVFSGLSVLGNDKPILPTAVVLDIGFHSYHRVKAVDFRDYLGAEKKELK